MNKQNMQVQIKQYAGPLGLSQEDTLLLLKESYPDDIMVFAKLNGHLSSYEDKPPTITHEVTVLRNRFNLEGVGDSWEEALINMVETADQKRQEKLAELEKLAADLSA